MLKFIAFTIPLLILSACSQAPAPILVITGGHDYDQEAFNAMLNSFDMPWLIVEQPRANEMIANGEAENYAALVFYDMTRDNISDEQKEGYRRLLRKGVGLVFLHHALVSYQNWPEFESIIGGKYIENAGEGESPSTYQHDVVVNIHIVDPTHPLTHGLADFVLHDEVYGNFRTASSIQPLLTTDHPESGSTIAWWQQVEKSKVVYIQPGHGREAFENPTYRRLLKQAIQWVK